MIELNVKTLDGKNRSFCVPDDITVKQFKEKIANSIDIGADTQRLIYQGRVLQDEKKLNHYDVNGKTIHVVARPPPSTHGPSSSTSTSSSSQGASASRDGNTFVLGSFTLPSDMVDPTQVQNITQQVITGMGDLGRNARVSTRSAGDGSSVDVHIHLGSVGPPEVQSASQMRVDQARRMIQQAVQTLDRLENPPSDENSEGSSPMDTPAAGGATASGTDRSSPEGGSPQQNARGSDSDNNNSTRGRRNSRPRSPQHPTPAALGELMNEVFALNRRLQPHLERYQSNLMEDPQYENDDARRTGQRLFNLVSEALHYVSHAYHSISDLMIDMQRPTPREVRAPPSMLSHAMPVQAQINVQGGPGAPQRPRPQTTSTTTASAPRTSTTTTTSSSQPPRGPPGAPPAGVRMSSTPLSANGSSSVASTMFMEFSPNAVTINSVSAHVLPADEALAFAANTNTTPSTNRPSPAPNPSQFTPPGPRPGGGPQHIRMQIPVQIPMMGGMPGMAPGGANPPGIPPEVMQNIFQMVSNQGFPGFPGGVMGPNIGANSTAGGPQRTTAATSTSTSTSSSSSRPFSAPRTTSTSSTQTGAARTSSNPNSRQGSPRTDRRAQHAAYVIPGPPFAMLPGFGGLSPGGGPVVDPFLPCQSRHFLTERAQQAAGGMGGETGLANMVSNLVSSWMGQQNVHPHPPQSQASTGTAQTTTTSTSSATTGPLPAGVANLLRAASRPTTTGATSASSSSSQSAATPGGTEPNFVTAFRQFLQEGQQTSSSSGDTDQQSQDPAFTDEVFTQLVRGISNYVAQAALGRPTDTIAGFLSSLGDAYNINPTEGVLMDVLNVASQHLTFTDVMAIFYGQPAPLQSLQGPLREMVGERILQGQPVSDTSVQQAVERLMDDISPEIDTACENVQGRDDIDFRATLQEFVRHHLQVAIRFAMNDTSPEYAQHIYTLCQRVIHEFIALGTHCLDGGEQALQRFIENQVRHISRDVNPMIQQWMVSIPVREMQRMLPEINIPTSDLDRYIRRRGEMETSPQSQSSDGSFMSAESVEAGEVMSVETSATVASSNKEAMEVDSPTDSGAAASERTLTPESYEELANTLPPPPTADPRDEGHVRLGSEDWHQAVPPDWVPIIARDVRRQNREPPQAPFSDAYLHGMPAKRRKVLSDRRPESELTDLSNIVPETLRRAVAAAGVEPRSSVDELTQDASASASLHNAFEQQVCESVRERINKDPDFIPEKFPNADRFFKNKK